jgi:hypothetical protein
MSDLLSTGKEISIGLNSQTAEWINGQQQRMEKGTKLLMEIALSIGEVLVNVQTSHNETFAEWVNKNLNFSRPTAYRYISLFYYKAQVSAAENLSEAYKMIETLEAQKKETEDVRALRRVAEYRNTGIKPENWRRGTDDKLVKEAEERDARLDALEGEIEARKERREAKNSLLVPEQSSYAQEYERQQESGNEQFLKTLCAYLSGLANDDLRAGACNAVIKECRKVLGGLGKTTPKSA